MIFRKTEVIFRKMFVRTKHRNWFSVKWISTQPNTWIHFPFRKIAFSKNEILSENAFMRTKHSLRCKILPPTWVMGPTRALINASNDFPSIYFYLFHLSEHFSQALIAKFQQWSIFFSKSQYLSWKRKFNKYSRRAHSSCGKIIVYSQSIINVYSLLSHKW